MRLTTGVDVMISLWTKLKLNLLLSQFVSLNKKLFSTHFISILVLLLSQGGIHKNSYVNLTIILMAGVSQLHKIAFKRHLHFSNMAPYPNLDRKKFVRRNVNTTLAISQNFASSLQIQFSDKCRSVKCCSAANQNDVSLL